MSTNTFFKKAFLRLELQLMHGCKSFPVQPGIFYKLIFALHPLHALQLIIKVDLQLGRSHCVAIILQKKQHLQLLLQWNDGSFFNEDFARRRAEAPPLLWFV